MQYVGFLAGGYRRRWSRNSWRRRPSGRCQRNGNAMGVAGQEGPFRSAIYPSAIEAFETAGRQGGGARDWPKNGSLASRWDSSDDDDDPGRTPDPICERVDRVLGRVGPDGHFNGFKHLPPLPPPQRRQRPRSIATRQSPSTPEGACAASPCWRCRTRHEPTPSRAAIHRVLEAVIRQGVLPILRARHCSGSPPLEVVAERLVDSLLDPTAGIDATLATIEAIVRPCGWTASARAPVFEQAARSLGDRWARDACDDLAITTALATLQAALDGRPSPGRATRTRHPPSSWSPRRGRAGAR